MTSSHNLGKELIIWQTQVVIKLAVYVPDSCMFQCPPKFKALNQTHKLQFFSAKGNLAKMEKFRQTLGPKYTLSFWKRTGLWHPTFFSLLHLLNYSE